jgi:hypothetical protein
LLLLAWGTANEASHSGVLYGSSFARNPTLFDLISSPKSIVPGREAESLSISDFHDHVTTGIPFFFLATSDAIFITVTDLRPKAQKAETVFLVSCEGYVHCGRCKARALASSG